MHKLFVSLLAICLLLAPTARTAQAGSLPASGEPARCASNGQPAQGGGSDVRGLWRWCELPGSKVGQAKRVVTAGADAARSPAANELASPPHLPTHLGRARLGEPLPAAVATGATLRGLRVRWQI